MRVFDELNSLTTYLNSETQRTFQVPSRVLMVSPKFFDIKYSINPHMRTVNGELHKVNKTLAENQWDALVDYYRGLGVEVDVLPGASELPDMVFAANHGMVWQFNDDCKPNVLMSRMRSKFRQPEIPLFEAWYQKNGYTIRHLNGDVSFEGNGDALISPAHGIVFGGYGPRTDEWVYDEMAERFKLPVVRLELVSEEFYHLDTCLSILNGSTAVLYPEAIARAGREMIYSLFENVIEVNRAEATRYFSCNSHSPDGKHLVTHVGDSAFIRKAEELGFKCTEVDTSEFIKAGGSVFCMKMMVY